jgi:hypothetical protein
MQQGSAPAAAGGSGQRIPDTVVISTRMMRLCLVTLALLALPPSQELLTLEVRVFDQGREVTADTRVTVHVAGDRGKPVAHAAGRPGGVLMRVPRGIYDAQAIEHRHGRVINIRWAERLVVMPYGDEGGHHLQVINFATGYGALQIRSASPVHARDSFLLLGPAGLEEYTPVTPGKHGYVLFVVPAGEYDMRVTRDERVTWHHGIDIPLDRTRFWVAP